MSGVLYLMPNYLDESNEKSFIAPCILDIARNCSYYLAENIRTARRFISSLQLGLNIEDLHFIQLDKNSRYDDMQEVMSPLIEGHDLCIISEAGLPGIADPGNIAVQFAHDFKKKVCPLPGSSSIILGLISSGFNGQNFSFRGHIPIKDPERKKFIRKIEANALREGSTEIFMETPYRNDRLMKELIQVLNPETLLSISSGITGKNEFIATKSIAAWSKQIPKLHKIPTIFSIGTY